MDKKRLENRSLNNIVKRSFWQIQKFVFMRLNQAYPKIKSYSNELSGNSFFHIYSLFSR